MARTRSVTSIVAVALLAAVLLFGAIPAAFAEKTIALSTGTIELSLEPGGSASDKIAVANNGDEPFKAMIYTSNVVYDESGVPSYVKPNGEAAEFLTSPASWLTLRMPAETQVIANTPYVELEPGEEMVVDFDLVVPDGAAPGDYSAIVFFEMFDNEQAAGTTSQVSGRLGARITVRVTGDVIDRVDLAPYAVRGLVIGDVVPYSFTLSNEGNIDKAYVPSLVVLDSSEAEVQRMVLEEHPVVYASNAREYSGAVELDRPLFGKYTLRAEIAFDGDAASGSGAAAADTLEKDRTFWVFPLWFAIAVVLAIGLPILWLVWRSSVKSAARKRERAARRGETAGVAAEGSLESPGSADEA